jgi:RHH-type proline utilization regulon transcriptional repressor/proline dehydrogenase/delta 1-pyrroline-5-carboxylate dehydrogenase
LEPHQRWLLEPRLLDEETELWSPGIVAGVRPGDWLAQTEVFGPVLALIAADDLDEAIEMQNSTAYGLTGGLWSLDPVQHRMWLERVEVGNAYINRAITGAIVGRQPFGGWKRSGVGAGAKAGGPNYVAQLMRFADDGRPTKSAEPGPAAKALLETVRETIDDDSELQALASAARSDAYWVAHEFGIERDEAQLFCERNVLRYRPVPSMVVRVGQGAASYELARTLLALHALGSVAQVSVNPEAEIVGAGVPFRLVDASGVHAMSESPEAFKARMALAGGGRIRLLGSEEGLSDLAPDVYVDARPVVVSGRVELLRYLREQSVSATMHRFGSPVGDG